MVRLKKLVYKENLKGWLRFLLIFFLFISFVLSIILFLDKKLKLEKIVVLFSISLIIFTVKIKGLVRFGLISSIREIW